MNLHGPSVVAILPVITNGSYIIQVQFLIPQLIISTHFNVSTPIGGLLQELNVQWSLLARWRGEQTVPHVT